VELNQPLPQPDVAIMEIKNNVTVGRYDVVMDTGPGYESKRQESAEMMLDLMKTPLAEPVIKVGADLIVRNMDFAGADDLANRLAPTTPQGLEQAMKNLPKEAQGIITAMQGQMQQMQQALQQAHLEPKYKGDIEDKWMRTDIQKTQMQTAVKAHDTEMRDSTAERDTLVKAHASLGVAEINQAGQLLNTHVEAAHNKDAAKELVKAGERATQL
jgi:hypothetical protein